MNDAAPDVTATLSVPERIGHTAPSAQNGGLKRAIRRCLFGSMGGKVNQQTPPNDDGQQDDATDHPDRVAGKFTPQSRPSGSLNGSISS